MRKFLILIAGAAVAYGLVGAAASSLTVSQAVIPAQGNVGAGLVGQCTDAVTISYEYQKDTMGTFTDEPLSSGQATHVVAIIVTPVDTDLEDLTNVVSTCTWDLETEAGDLVALSIANDATPGFTLKSTEPQPWSASGGLPAELALDGVQTDWGGWSFGIEDDQGDPVPISAFDPGVITVTLWRVPPTEYVASE